MSTHTEANTEIHQAIEVGRIEPLHVVVAGRDTEFVESLTELLRQPPRGARVSVCEGPASILHLTRVDHADVVVVDGGRDTDAVKALILGLPTWNVNVIALVEDPVELWDLPSHAPRFTALACGLDARDIIDLLCHEVCWEAPVN